MNASEISWVADHMGHDVNIHSQHYRMQPELVEKTKVAKVLLAMERGVTKSDVTDADLLSESRLYV